MGAVGVVFGGTQTGLTVLATEAGAPGLAGVVYALLGVGSAVAGFATAWVPTRFGHERRLVASPAAMLLLAAPLLVVPTLAGTAVVVTALGLAVAPVMISAYSATERLVPDRSAGAAMTLLASGAAAGLVLALATAGRLRRSLQAHASTPQSRVASSA